jgi:hypothetical protein
LSELFELSLLGGALERRYRQKRPEIDRLPWKELRPERLAPELVERGRRFWTEAALAEYRAAAACAAVSRALVEARAPLDLIALGSGFLLDELAHVEMCARVANQLGGGAPLAYDAERLVSPTSADLSPLGRAAELVLRVHCVSETFLFAMQRQNRQDNRLVRAVLRRITKDEAGHARFGWIFFDWAEPLLDGPTRERLRQVAAEAIGLLQPRPGGNNAPETLGWMPAGTYSASWAQVIEDEIRQPLRERGLLV